MRCSPDAGARVLSNLGRPSGSPTGDAGARETGSTLRHASRSLRPSRFRSPRLSGGDSVRAPGHRYRPEFWIGHFQLAQALEQDGPDRRWRSRRRRMQAGSRGATRRRSRCAGNIYAKQGSQEEARNVLKDWRGLTRSFRSAITRWPWCTQALGSTRQRWTGSNAASSYETSTSSSCRFDPSGTRSEPDRRLPRVCFGVAAFRARNRLHHCGKPRVPDPASERSSRVGCANRRPLIDTI